MAALTIDKLLDWFDRDIDAGCAEHSQIRAILEQHRDIPHQPVFNVTAWRQQEDIKAIRAFVERVRKRYRDAGTLQGLTSMLDELAAMEKETNAGTND